VTKAGAVMMRVVTFAWSKKEVAILDRGFYPAKQSNLISLQKALNDWKKSATS